MKDKLILLTAAYRFDNLCHISDSIYENIHDMVDYIWLVCRDQFNGYGEWNKFESYSKKLGLRMVYSDSGKSGQPNYGGDMYNEPLKNLIEECKLDTNSSWIYILDDDNLIHPNLLDSFKTIHSEMPEKVIIWLSYQLRNGFQSVVPKAQALLPDRDNWLINLSDPSTILIRLDILESNGFYNSGSDYDVTTIKPLVEKYFDYTAFSDDLWYCDKRLMSAYHNACRTKEDFRRDKEAFDDMRITDVSFRVSERANRWPTSYPISTKLGKIILDLIEQEYKSKGWI